MPRLLPTRLQQLPLAQPDRAGPGLCKLCADGATLPLLHQADVPLAPQRRAVLEAAAAALMQ